MLSVPNVTVLRNLGWQGAIDIGLLTVIAFQLYVWLRGTVALQVLGGLAAILIASLVADYLGMVLSARVLQGVSAVGAVLIAVLFRDEIRHGLRRADPLGWLWRRWHKDTPDADVYLELARGLALLASRRIGALIVLPRNDSVDEYTTGGKAVDALVTPEVLHALFHTSSPLHDGAAIVEHGRLRTAGAVLPLSTASDLPAELGTRHRAAVGLSAECDAIVVAVSEERGTITMAGDGALTPVPCDPKHIATQLREALSRTPLQQPAERRRLPRWRTVAAFFVSLLLVTAVWVFVMGSRPIVVTSSLPVQLRGLPEGRSADIVIPRSGNVRLRVRGPRFLLGEDQLRRIEAWVDLGGLRPGRHRVQVRVSLPPALELVEREPRRAVIVIRRKRKDTGR